MFFKNKKGVTFLDTLQGKNTFVLCRPPASFVSDNKFIICHSPALVKKKILKNRAREPRPYYNVGTNVASNHIREMINIRRVYIVTIRVTVYNNGILNKIIIVGADPSVRP